MEVNPLELWLVMVFASGLIASFNKSVIYVTPFDVKKIVGNKSATKKEINRLG